MSYLLRMINWKTCIILSLIVLPALIVLNFYGLYTDRFYLFKVDNYIFPLLSLVHFLYLYVIWFKISESEYVDPQMRNVEYGLYAILLVYIFKASDTAYVLLNASQFDAYLLPDSFQAMGITVLSLQLLLIFLTLLTFTHRRREIGPYNFDNINENIDSWQ
ncbi:MAG: hypothetical protein HKP60_11590 [Eudoraea sp.]|nr:hypothetical protein [Eudoraea sp.]NNJ41502.1 hypothetical protein [Eudoraea sp.]